MSLKPFFASLAPALALVVVALFAPASGALSLDQTYGSGALFSPPPLAKVPVVQADAIATSPSGGYVLAGGSGRNNGDPSWWSIAKFNADGSPDANFGSSGQVAKADLNHLYGWYGSGIDAVAEQRDGKVVAAGLINVSTRADQRRYDQEWGGDPGCNCFAVRGAIAVARYTRTGVLDRTFGNRGVRVIRGITSGATDTDIPVDIGGLAIDGAGRIYIGADSSYADQDGPPRPLMYRLTSNGHIDRSFAKRGRLLDQLGSERGFYAAGLTLLANGELLLTGTSDRSSKRSSDGIYDWAALRITSRGTVDLGYGNKGLGLVRFAQFGSNLDSVDVAPDGEAYFSGCLLLKNADGTQSTASHPVVVRLGPSGQSDVGFNAAATAAATAASAGEIASVVSLSLQQDGSLHTVIEPIGSDSFQQLDLGPTGNASGAPVDFPDLSGLGPPGWEDGFGWFKWTDDHLLAFGGIRTYSERRYRIAVVRFVD